MLRLRVFGGLVLTADDGQLAGAAAQRRRLALLAALAVAGERGASRDRLLALLWPERDSAGGRQALSQALYALRRDTGADALVLGAGTETLRLDPAVASSDVGDFEAAHARGALAEAVGHYAGPFLDGVHLGGDDGTFERWVDDQRARLGALAERALETLAGEAEDAGDLAAAARWWRRLTELDPLRTRAAEGLIRALAASGDRHGALRHAAYHTRRVREELESPPAASIAALADRLRVEEGAPDARVASAPTAARGGVPGRVPPPPAALVGRERERAAAAALLRRRDIRLLTLSGAGGSGKTSLALQLAADVADAFELAAFVDLAPVRDASLVVPAVAAALGVREREDRSVFDGVVAALTDRRALLVLDNVEQVVAAAPELARLLAAAPDLTLLATSRLLLRLRGEHEFFVGPLELPDLAAGVEPRALAAVPAVELFLRRAREARPALEVDEAGLRTVAEICVRLDGLPLAIELAAARVRLLGPGAILARLADRRLDFLGDGARDLPARQRTLRDAVAWSHDLLGEGERRALRACAVFPGPFTLGAAGAVLDAGEDAVLAVAQGLTDASLLRRVGDDEDGPRLAMLETIREFALERLRASGEEDAARDRHLAHHLALADRLAPALAGAGQGEALARLAREREQMRAALAWADDRAGRGDAAPLRRLVRALWRGWLVAGQWAEGRGWLQRALRHGGDAPDGVHAELLAAAGALAQNQGDYADAYADVNGALAVWRALGDRAGEARALAGLGWLAWRRGQLADARRLSAESLTLHRALGDEHGVAQALSNLGWVALFQGRAAEAIAALTEALAIRERLDHPRDVAFTRTALAWATLRGGGTCVEERLEEALATFRAIGERQLAAFAVRVGAEAALLRGRAADAAALLERESVPVFRALGDRWGLYVALGELGDARLSAGALEDARAAYAESASIARALGDAYGMALSGARGALLAAADGDAARADAGAREATRAVRAMGAVLPPWLASRLEARSAAGG